MSETHRIGPERVLSDAYRAHMATATVVNRTHRVVRERARLLQARRATVRSLYIPLGVSAALLLTVAFAIWTALDEYDLSSNGVPDAGQQVFILLLWCLPISLAVLAVLLYRRSNPTDPRTDHEGAS